MIHAGARESIPREQRTRVLIHVQRTLFDFLQFLSPPTIFTWLLTRSKFKRAIGPATQSLCPLRVRRACLGHLAIELTQKQWNNNYNMAGWKAGKNKILTQRVGMHALATMFQSVFQFLSHVISCFNFVSNVSICFKCFNLWRTSGCTKRATVASQD